MNRKTENEVKQRLQDALNNNLPNGYDDFDDFADTVIEVAGPDPEGREWTILPYHTGQRQNPNDWSSPMIVGREITNPTQRRQRPGA